jgi:hypothetical protein
MPNIALLVTVLFVCFMIVVVGVFLAMPQH